jgi:hypothetical protein
MNGEPGKTESHPFIERAEIKAFIKDRGIHTEDFGLIEELAQFPNDLIIVNLHNVFNTYHERSGVELQRMMQAAHDDESRRLCEAIFRFYEKYSWPASWNLVRLLEEK